MPDSTELPTMRGGASRGTAAARAAREAVRRPAVTKPPSPGSQPGLRRSKGPGTFTTPAPEPGELTAPVPRKRRVVRRHSVGRYARQLVFFAALGGLVFVSLSWAMDPTDHPELVARRPLTAEERGLQPSASPSVTPAATAPAPAPVATPSGPPPAELIAAAPPTDQTTVQVLDAGGGGERTDAAAATLRALGYDVINVTSSREDVPRTTVVFTDGHESEALAVRARDPRFADVRVNDRLSEGVDVHVLVGTDWSG